MARCAGVSRPFRGILIRRASRGMGGGGAFFFFFFLGAVLGGGGGWNFYIWWGCARFGAGGGVGLFFLYWGRGAVRVIRERERLIYLLLEFYGNFLSEQSNVRKTNRIF